MQPVPAQPTMANRSETAQVPDACRNAGGVDYPQQLAGGATAPYVCTTGYVVRTTMHRVRRTTTMYVVRSTEYVAAPVVRST
jgi:hypothetical protein